jgi:putative transposase
MGGMAKSPNAYPARYGCALASDRIQTVLELARARARSSWKETRQSRTARTHLRMVSENPTWGAPRIHGELKMLGFDISERTVLRWMRKAPRDPEPGRRWAAFLKIHREAIAAMDFFTVPTLTFGVLYCFFVIHHDRRRILQCNVTRHPTTAWLAQQLREAFPYNSAPKYLIFDREHTFHGEVLEAVDGLAPRSEAPGRTAWPNAGSAPAVVPCLTT